MSLYVINVLGDREEGGPVDMESCAAVSSIGGDSAIVAHRTDPPSASLAAQGDCRVITSGVALL